MKVGLRNTILVMFCFVLPFAEGSELEIPHTFENGQVTSATEMNANFEAIKSAVNDNYSRISAPRSQFVGFSSTKLDGKGGIFAMQQACQVFRAESHVCDTSELNGSKYSDSAMSSVEENDQAWIRVKLAGGVNDYGDGATEDGSIVYGNNNASFGVFNMTSCEGWKYNGQSSNAFGATINASGGLGYSQCHVLNKVACCL